MANRWSALVFVGVVMVAQACQGALVIRVQDGPGLSPGQTRWTFSGSTTYSKVAADGILAGGPSSAIREWKGAAAASDYVVSGGYNNYLATLVSGSVDVAVTQGISTIISSNIDGLHIDHDSSGDDFGISLTSLSDLVMQDGAILSLSGSAVFDVDFAKLNQGVFNFSDYDDPLAGYLPITMVVQAVPEPASSLVGLGLMVAAYGTKRLRRKSV